MSAKNGLEGGSYMALVTPIGAVPAGFATAVDSEPAAEATERRVQIIVRMTLAERKALRQIALDQNTTAQALAEDAIRNVLRRHGIKSA